MPEVKKGINPFYHMRAQSRRAIKEYKVELQKGFIFLDCMF
jgi:hypothetical protein